jgi:hypothetical protein
VVLRCWLNRTKNSRELQQNVIPSMQEDRGYRAIGAFGSLKVILGAKLFRLSRRHCRLFSSSISLLSYDSSYIQICFHTESFRY